MGKSVRPGINVANTSREMVGVGGIINPKHEGPAKRPTEALADIEDWSPHTDKTPEDFKREKAERERLERKAEVRKILNSREKIG